MGLTSSAPANTLTQLAMGLKDTETLPAPAAAPAEPTRGRRNRWTLLLGVALLAGLRLFAWSREGQGWLQVRSRYSECSTCVDEPTTGHPQSSHDALLVPLPRRLDHAVLFLDRAAGFVRPLFDIQTADDPMQITPTRGRMRRSLSPFE